MIGNPFEESLSGQQRQSLAFANLIAGVRQRTGGRHHGRHRKRRQRPSRARPIRRAAKSLTAGEWNRAAAANNRVEFAAETQLRSMTATEFQKAILTKNSGPLELKLKNPRLVVCRESMSARTAV